MSVNKIFSNKIIYIVSMILSIFSIIIYVLAIIVRLKNINNSVVGLIVIFLISIIAFLQTYLLITNNRKAIFYINIHLTFLLFIAIYELINEFLNYGFTKVINGVFYIIIFLLISFYIVNKNKISKFNSGEINKIGEREI
ncbi:hypothetical protein [Frigoriflavimonas asaccharolytica]|uniref:Putative membrane protein n=1 Tax=Frigoriflavimonas asaccharolytica TaxID=2735899 RepID=A0A8J8G5W9_9FLAO|nr:hypothetical protein [Frigoriflavimonas asaccharolytica]NRS91824.1 putative membrane protein [Frigoriflavimonas asaccharolytica]